MKTKSIGFIGGGRITRILLQAFSNKKADFISIVVCDTNIELLKDLKKSYPKINITDSPSLAAKQEIIFIALHPPVIMDVLDCIQHEVHESLTIISLAPKISIEKIAAKLSKVKNIVRLIPNATSIINEGYNPVSFASEMKTIDRDEMMELLKILGKTIETDEKKLESYAILSAMLPTYFWFQMQELVRIGSTIGLTEEESRDSVRDTLMAAVRTFFDSGLTPGEVMDLIPVKPIGDYENQIINCYTDKLITLYNKIKSS
jgi:pyrroline-5-carboxylate reductase